MKMISFSSFSSMILIIFMAQTQQINEYLDFKNNKGKNKNDDC
jgi:hypothetical protein